MPNVNKVILIGNLTRDPINSSTKNGSHLCRFTIATNRKYTSMDGQQREEVTFVDIMASGRLAENCSLYLHKGDPVYIEGRLHIYDWQDKNNVSRRAVEVIMENMQLLAPKSNQPHTPGEIDPSVARAFQGVGSGSTTPSPYPAQRPNVPPAPVAPLAPPTSEDTSDSYDNPPDDNGVF